MLNFKTQLVYFNLCSASQNFVIFRAKKIEKLLPNFKEK